MIPVVLSVRRECNCGQTSTRSWRCACSRIWRHVTPERRIRPARLSVELRARRWHRCRHVCCWTWVRRLKYLSLPTLFPRPAGRGCRRTTCPIWARCRPRYRRHCRLHPHQFRSWNKKLTIIKQSRLTLTKICFYTKIIKKTLNINIEHMEQ